MCPKAHHCWTEEEVEIVRRDYSQTHQSSREIARRLGLSVLVVRHQIYKMGLAKRTDRRPWAEAEEEKLRELLPLYSAPKVARLLHRTVNSVTVRSVRLGLSRRSRFGWYTKHEVCQILGMDHKRLGRRIDSGALPATWHNGRLPGWGENAQWHIAQEDLRRFIRQYPEELQGRNVDMVQVVEVLVGLEEVKRRNNDMRMMHQ